MTANKFNKEVSNILQKYGIDIDKYGYALTETPFGIVSIRLSKTPHQKFYALYMRFVEDFDISYFYKYFSEYENINKFSKKWNLYNEDAEYILNELEERLNNLKYILERDGKICGQQHKPFLAEIEQRS